MDYIYEGDHEGGRECFCHPLLPTSTVGLPYMLYRVSCLETVSLCMDVYKHADSEMWWEVL